MTTLQDLAAQASERRAARIAGHEQRNRKSREAALQPRFEMALQRHYVATGQDVTVVPGSGDVWTAMEIFGATVIRNGDREEASCFFDGRLLITEELVYVPANDRNARAA